MAGAGPQAPAPTSTQVGGTDQPRKALTGYTPTPEEKQLISKVEERIHWTGRDNARWALERQMFETIAFYCGIQWIEYSDTTRRFTRWNAPNWFPTPVTNLMAPRVGIMHAGLARSQPQGRVRPNTNEPGDYMAAKVAEKLIGHFYDVTDEDMLRDKASLMASLTGTVIAEDIFNPRAGRMLRVPRLSQQEEPVMEPAAQCMACGATEDLVAVGQSCPACGAPDLSPGESARTWPDGSPIRTSKLVPETGEDGQPIVDMIPEGEIESRVRTLMNFYWDQKGIDLKEARWCGEAMYVDLDVIDEMFPDLGGYVAAEEGVDSMNFYEASLLSLVGPSVQGTAHYGGSLYFRHGAVLRKYQEKPSKAFPQGINAITAHGILLHNGPLPIVDQDGECSGDFNYTEFRYDVVPGRFAGRTPAEDMVPLQKRVNGIDAQVILNRKTMLSPWVMAPKGSGLDPSRQYMRPGATVLYNFVGVGAAPQVVPGTPLPAQIMEERAQAIQAMDQLAQDAAGLAQKDMPAGVKSGIAMNFAKEAKEEVTIPRLKRWGAWIAERDRKRLLLAQAYYREPRVVKLMGLGNEWQARLFKGSDLRGNTDVSVDPGTLIWRSQSAKQQAIMDATEAGLIDINDPLQKQKMIEELGIVNFDTPIGPDRRRALKENAQMDEGEQVEVTPQEDMQIHLAEHLLRIKDPSFDELPDLAKQAHLGHFQATQQAVQQAQEQADQAQEEKLKRRMVLAVQAKQEGLEALISGAEKAITDEQEQQAAQAAGGAA